MPSWLLNLTDRFGNRFLHGFRPLASGSRVAKPDLSESPLLDSTVETTGLHRLRFHIQQHHQLREERCGIQPNVNVPPNEAVELSC